MRGSLTLGDLEGTLQLLEIRCTKCDRYGRERLARLIERWGRGARLPDVRHQLSADCPRHHAAIHERCDVYFPQLVDLERQLAFLPPHHGSAMLVVKRKRP